MDQLEFDAAWNNSPPTKVVEMFRHKNCVVRVERPLDAHWAFRGTVPEGPLDVVASCVCQQDLASWKWAGPPAPIPEVKGCLVKVCCVGVRIVWKSTERKRDLYNWYFVGQCPECKKVYWFYR